MRLYVELEDGKSETVFVPARAAREADLKGIEGYDQSIYCAWRAFHRKGWTDIEDWEEFGEVAWVEAAEDLDDPKA